MKDLTIREAHLEEDLLIARHFYRLWQDNNVPNGSIQPHWQEITQDFIEDARANLAFKSFVAEVSDRAIGSIGCQLFGGLYPNILTDNFRKYGYIWNVYVEPEHRCLGIATKLTQHACVYLKSLGCNRAILHASPYGKSLYQKLGFVESNEMCLNL